MLRGYLARWFRGVRDGPGRARYRRRMPRGSSNDQVGRARQLTALLKNAVNRGLQFATDRKARQDIKRSIKVVLALRGTYASTQLWVTELSYLIAGRRVPEPDERYTDGFVPQRFPARRGGAAMWFRIGVNDVYTWSEIYVDREYGAPWPLPPNARVLDLGAHAGYFARWALQHWPVASILSLEPEAGNVAVLSKNHSEASDPRWRFMQAAASTSAGVARFAGGRGSSGGIAIDGEDEVPTVDALQLLAEVDIAKIDIEGGEWGLLRDERFAASAPAMLVLEYHPQADVTRPREEAFSALRAAGYDVVDGPRSDGGVGLLWARRSAAAPR